MSEHCTAGMNGEQVYRTERANVSWWPKQGNIRPRSGVIKVPFPHIGCAPRQSEAGGRSEKSSFKKKRRNRFRYVAGSNQGYVGGYVRGWTSRLKYRRLILRHFRCGARGARCPMRGRIRGPERWTLAGWDDVHRNPDRSSRPAVLLYCSRSWLG